MTILDTLSKSCPHGMGRKICSKINWGTLPRLRTQRKSILKFNYFYTISQVRVPFFPPPLPSPLLLLRNLILSGQTENLKADTDRAIGRANPPRGTARPRPRCLCNACCLSTHSLPSPKWRPGQNIVEGVAWALMTSHFASLPRVRGSYSTSNRQ